VPTEDPGAATDRSRTTHIAATLILLVVHAGLFGATLALLGLLVMSTDACGSVKCGDSTWIDRAMGLGTWGGGAILLVDFVVAGYLLLRRRRAVVSPIVGCIAQVALAIAAVAMELQAGPV
jgi:hypothetical protein